MMHKHYTTGHIRTYHNFQSTTPLSIVQYNSLNRAYLTILPFNILINALNKNQYLRAKTHLLIIALIFLAIIIRKFW